MVHSYRLLNIIQGYGISNTKAFLSRRVWDASTHADIRFDPCVKVSMLFLAWLLYSLSLKRFLRVDTLIGSPKLWATLLTEAYADEFIRFIQNYAIRSVTNGWGMTETDLFC